MKKSICFVLAALLLVGFLVVPAVAETPKAGGILKILTTRQAISFGYPPKIIGADRNYVPPYFDRLLTVADDGSYEPRLATSWETAADGKSITFKLRRGVKFHDGTDFNAAAVKFNLDGIIPPTRSILNGVASIEVIDDFTVKVNLSAFNNLILYQIATEYACYMVSPTAVQKNGIEWAEKHPVGTGPFKFVSYERNTNMIMTKNEDYWAKGLPYLDGIEINTVADEMTQLASFKAGECNAIFDAGHETAGQLRDAGFKVLVAPGNLYAISIDTKNNKILADKRVREAIEYAIDKEAICNGPGLGMYKSCYQVVDTTNPSYNKDLPPRKYNPEKAKKLLAEAGYPDGFSFEFAALNSYWREGIVALQAYLAQVGIKMDINYVTSPVFGKIRSAGQIKPGTAAQMPLNTFSNSLIGLEIYFRSGAPLFKYVERPAGVDALLEKAKAARTDEEMLRISREISKIIYEDETIIPIWMSPRIVVTDDKLQNSGWFINNDSSNNDFGRETWLK